MKWMLVVVIFGATPIKTDLVFETLDICLKSEENIRRQQSKVFNDWSVWARKNPDQSNYPQSKKFMMNRIGLESPMTCIPHKYTN